MNFNFKQLNKKNSHRKYYEKILTVRLPCNPIFPIGPIYLADHIHKCFPNVKQQFIDLAIIPPNKVSKYLTRKIDQFRPHLIIFHGEIYKFMHLSMAEVEIPLNSLRFSIQKTSLRKLEVLGRIKINCISLWGNIQKYLISQDGT